MGRVERYGVDVVAGAFSRAAFQALLPATLLSDHLLR
jgi:hypothetical protein